jgi:hypothetical protein
MCRGCKRSRDNSGRFHIHRFFVPDLERRQSKAFGRLFDLRHGVKSAKTDSQRARAIRFAQSYGAWDVRWLQHTPGAGCVGRNRDQRLDRTDKTARVDTDKRKTEISRKLRRMLAVYSYIWKMIAKHR